MVQTGVLTGQIVMVFATVLLGLWSATQWTAAALGYQMHLGAPWFDLSGTPIYHPYGQRNTHYRVKPCHLVPTHCGRGISATRSPRRTGMRLDAVSATSLGR
jgi:hypothetical protein